MKFDSAELLDGQVLHADICIVGAGAAGITIALELIATGLDVVVLESGGLDPEAHIQALYAGTVEDSRLHSPPDRYRQRRFGGTTTIWGGRCMPFDPIDFEKRDYIPNSGWPIDYDTLAPYYPKANRLCEAGEFAYRSGEAFPRPLPPMLDGFNSDNFTTDTLERFSCPTNFGARYGHKLKAAANVRVVLNANVTRISLNRAGDRVEWLEVRASGSVKTFEVIADRVVLATGGLEVPRLLLSNRDVHPHGIGNDHDVVGRYYMCHIAGTVGTIKVDRPLHAVSHGYDVSDDGTYCRRRFALRPETQRNSGIGNFIARFHHPRITDPAHRNGILSMLFLAKYFIPYEYRIRLHGTEPTTVAQLVQHASNVLSGAFDAAGFAWHMLRDRRLADRKFPSIIIKSKANLYSLDFHAEQEPNAASRVTVGDKACPLGLPRIHVDWRYTQGDVRTVKSAIELLAGDFTRSRLGTFVYDPEELEFEMTRYGAYGGHHLGTARMGTDRKTSVVDAECRVHGVPNLYIASAATFPTSSQANPTLTIVALALRLAKQVQADIRAARAVPQITTSEEPNHQTAAGRVSA